MIQLSHIGEELIAQILAESREAMEAVCGEFVTTVTQDTFVPELHLNNCGDLSFDGAHKIDVAVLNENRNDCYPIEAKLGFDRLGKNEFERRFLNECETSHNNTRVKGCMISILERKLPEACKNRELAVKRRDKTYTVTSKWSLVCRKPVLEKWKKNGRPNFSTDCRVVSFESLVEMYGSRSAFNSLVKQLISIDFYKAWQCST